MKGANRRHPGEAQYEVASPLGKERAGMVRPAARLDTLRGKTIGELWDGVFSGDFIFAELEQLLSKEYPGVRFVNYKEFGSTHHGDEEGTIASLPDKLSLKGCDAVISGVGG